MFGWIKNALGGSSEKTNTITRRPPVYDYDEFYNRLDQRDTGEHILSHASRDHDQYIGAGSPGFDCEDGVLTGRTDLRRPHLRSELFVEKMLEFAKANNFDYDNTDYFKYEYGYYLLYVPGLPHVLGVTHVSGMSLVELMQKPWDAADRKIITRMLTGHKEYGVIEMVAEAVGRVDDDISSFLSVVPRPAGMGDTEYHDKVWDIAFMQTLKTLQNEFTAHCKRRSDAEHVRYVLWAEQRNAEEEYRASQAAMVRQSPPSVIDKVADFASRNPLVAGIAVGLLCNKLDDRK